MEDLSDGRISPGLSYCNSASLTVIINCHGLLKHVNNLNKLQHPNTIKRLSHCVTYIGSV